MINRLLSKSLPRARGVKVKLVMALLVLAAVPITVVGIYGVTFSLGTIEEKTLRHLEYELSSKAADIERFLQGVSKDVLFFSRTGSLVDLIDFDGTRFDGTGSAGLFANLRKGFEDEALILSETHPEYYQIRYIDEKGHELVRVDSDKTASVAVSVEKLQNKSSRYYFKAVNGYPEGRVYVSRMDLNKERGKVELPYKLVVRVATPVFNSFGDRRGVVIINIYASDLIEQIRDLDATAAGTTFLMDKDGLYLSHLTGLADESPFIFGPTTGIEKDYSIDVAASVLSGSRGTVKTDESIISYHPIRTGDSVSEGYWVLAMAYPKEAVFAELVELEAVFIAVGLAAVLGASILGVWMARRFTAPLLKLHQGVEWVAEGDFDHTIEIETGDEVEELAERFNAMAARLKVSRGRLEMWNEDLKMEVEAATTELVIEKNKLENLLRCATEGIVATDEQERVIICNPAAERILGVKKEEVIGKPFFECGREASKLGNVMDVGATLYPKTTTVSLDSMTLEISTARISHGGVKLGSMMVMRDISERQEMIDERMTMERQLFHADKLVSIGELSAGIAHEIGNPLAAIKAVIQSLDEEAPFVGLQKKYMERILKEVDRLSRFIKVFSAFAHPGAPLTTGCSLAQVIRDVTFLIKNEAHKHNVTISESVDSSIPDVSIDSDQLRQVFVNLFLNAIQAMEGGGKITVAASMAASGPGVYVSIIDTGPGMEEEHRTKIFDPFFTTKAAGTGLGLSIVHRILKENDGDIKVRTALGKGTIFELLLPTAGDGYGVGASVSAPPAV